MVKIVFFGTGKISQTFLENLNNNHSLLCITMPDKIALRGKKLLPPAVKTFALEKNIPFLQVEKWDENIIKTVKDFNADAGIAVSFGKIIPETVFNIPKFKVLNIHFSLLPKYRGAAPVQYALCNGDKKTGITVFYIDNSLDTGDILVQKSLPIDIKDNSEKLFDKMTVLGIEVMNEALELLQNGKISGKPQIGIPSFAPAFKKEDGLIDWKQPSESIYNKVRGLFLWPQAYTIVSTGNLAGKRLKIIEAEIVESDTIYKEAGKISSFEKNAGFIVLCGQGKLLIKKVQPENKTIMKAWDFLQGSKLIIGDALG